MASAPFPLRVSVHARLSIPAVGSTTNRPDWRSRSLPPLVFSALRDWDARSPAASGATATGLGAQAIRRERPRLLRSCSCSGMPPMASEGPSGYTELEEESDFDALLSPDGYIHICGFGSLLSGDLSVSTIRKNPRSRSFEEEPYVLFSALSIAIVSVSSVLNPGVLTPERSARSTFPELRNFRVALLRGFRRVFCHAAPVFFERGIARQETGEISSLSVEPCDGETLVVTTFEIKTAEIPSFIEREHEFRFLAVVPEQLDGSPYTRPAVLCARYSDDEYFRVRCKGSQDIYFQRYGRYNIHKIWRNDIFPCRAYLRHCVLAAKNLGQEAYDNFLDHTYIADRQTTIRQYLSSAGSGIMEEEPPESLRSRYGG